MKNINDKTFDINMTTMRDLNPDECEQVGGGWTPTLGVVVSLAFSCLGPALCPEESAE